MARDNDMTQIRQRGNSYQVQVYAGLDPVTGDRVYLRVSTTDLKEAKRIRTRLRAQADEQRHARTSSSVRNAYTAWLTRHDIADTTRPSYERYLRNYIGPAFGNEPIGKIKPRTLESFYAELRRCSVRCDGRPFVEHRIAGEHECRMVKHKRPPGRPPVRGCPPHDCTEAGCTVIECRPHKCRPLAGATVAKVHFALSAMFNAAIRWEWLSVNPCDIAKHPSQGTPQPDPPTTEEAARITDAAWETSPMWGVLVWLVFVTGMRRGELLTLRWNDVDFAGARLRVRRAVGRVRGALVEKDTKTHHQRVIALDPATLDILTEHQQRYLDRMRQLGTPPDPQALLFSYAADHGKHCDPDAISHKYSELCAGLGIDSHLHALRHYSATELLTAGHDLRTVAGRLGHGGGGATTLRVYAAWVNRADRDAAAFLGSRLRRPGTDTNAESRKKSV